MFPVGTRVVIIRGYFCSNEAKEAALLQQIQDFRPTGTIIYSRNLEHRVRLDQPFFKSGVVSMLLAEDLQVITPKPAHCPLNH